MIWSFDISQAPRGRYITVSRNNGKLIGPAEVFVPADVILATKCGKVTKSRWLPDEDRWLMLAAGEQPIAWQEWPTHPNSQSAETPTADKPEAHAQPLPDASGSPFAGPRFSAVPGGEPSIPSSDDGGAKMDCRYSGNPRQPDAMSVTLNTQSEQAAPLSDEDVPTFLKREVA